MYKILIETPELVTYYVKIVLSCANGCSVSGILSQSVLFVCFKEDEISKLINYIKSAHLFTEIKKGYY